jgi:hypothetical protein
MNVNFIFILLLWINTVAPCSATELPAINRFLLAAQADLDTVNAARKNIPELNGLSSWVEDGQIRVNAEDELDMPDSTSQTYAIRIKPKAWGQRDAEQKILKLRSHQADAQYNEAFNSELSRRYNLILDLVAQHKQTLFLLQSDQLLNKQVQMNRSLANSTEFNEGNLLDVEIASEQTQDMLALNLKHLQDLQQQLQLPTDSKDSLSAEGNLNWLLSVPQMQHIMVNMVAPNDIPEVIKSRLELEQRRAENQHKKSTQQLGVNLLRFQVNDSTDDPRKNLRLSFMVGINIPFGTENFQTTESRHDMYEAHFKLHDSVYTTAHSLEEKRAKMRWLLEEWRMAQRQLDKLAARLDKNYAKSNPQLGLALQIEHTKKVKELEDIHQEALILYISYLTIAGQLSNLPLRNWLQSDQPPLQAPPPNVIPAKAGHVKS